MPRSRSGSTVLSVVAERAANHVPVIVYKGCWALNSLLGDVLGV